MKIISWNINGYRSAEKTNSIKDYESIINRYMKIEYGMDVYSKNFPLYIIKK